MSTEDGEKRVVGRLAYLPELGSSQLIAFPTTGDISRDTTRNDSVIIVSCQEISPLYPAKSIIISLRIGPRKKLSRRLEKVIKGYPELLQGIEDRFKQE